MSGTSPCGSKGPPMDVELNSIAGGWHTFDVMKLQITTLSTSLASMQRELTLLRQFAATHDRELESLRQELNEARSALQLPFSATGNNDIKPKASKQLSTRQDTASSTSSTSTSSTEVRNISHPYRRARPVARSRPQHIPTVERIVFQIVNARAETSNLLFCGENGTAVITNNHEGPMQITMYKVLPYAPLPAEPRSHLAWKDTKWETVTIEPAKTHKIEIGPFLLSKGIEQQKVDYLIVVCHEGDISNAITITRSIVIAK